jgi:hypothetical protein
MTERHGMGGPLGELLGDAGTPPRDAVPRLPVHARVLPIVTPEGSDLVLACFRDPGGAAALHRELRVRIEGSLLGELSRTAADLREAPSGLDSLRLFVFAPMDGIAEAVRAFGMKEASCAGARWRTALARLRHEASEIGEPGIEEPASVWEASAVTAGEDVEKMEAMLVASTEEPWGARPGVPFARLARAFAELGLERPEPTFDGLSYVERTVTPDSDGVVRFVPPLVFQALADMVGAAVVRERKVDLDWALCEPDEHGVAPPPLLRMSTSEGHVHVPVALELLRRSVMPRQPREVIPPLGEWASSVFGP